MKPGAPLTRKSIAEAVNVLAGCDDILARVVERLGPPPLWNREPGFPTLIHIILEQQVSLASARSAFDRLNAVLTSVDPTSFLTLDDPTLREIGFSGQKTRYCRNLAEEILKSSLDLSLMPSLSDDEVCEELTKIKGIGPWTAQIYLLMVLGRPDIWPAGDLALAAAVRDLNGLAERPTPGELCTIAEKWRPFRSVAARLLWNHYLNP